MSHLSLNRDRFLDDDNAFGTPPVDSPLRLRILQLLHSRVYFFYSLFLLAITFFLFLWLILSKFEPESWIFIVLDGFVCLSFAADIAMRVYIATPSVYFDCGRPKNWTEKLIVIWNWFDFCVVWLSGLSFCLFLVSNKNSDEPKMDATVEVVLICFRAISSVLRFYGVLKVAGLNFRRMGQNTYRNLNSFDDSFSMNELIERGGGQSILEDDSSGLDEDDLFARPVTNSSSMYEPKKEEKPAKQESKPVKKQEKERESKNQGLFGSFAGGIGSAFGLNDSDQDASGDDDDSGLDEDDLFKRPEMNKVSTPTIGESLINSTTSENDLFQSCVQDPAFDRKKNKRD